MKDKRPWFAYKEFDTLRIILFQSISDHRIIQSQTITNADLITELLQNIEQIPAEGDMMISFGPDASYMQLIFEAPKEKRTVEVIQQRFKTPSTGFHSRNAKEQEIYQRVLELLNNDLD